MREMESRELSTSVLHLLFLIGVSLLLVAALSWHGIVCHHGELLLATTKKPLQQPQTRTPQRLLQEQSQGSSTQSNATPQRLETGGPMVPITKKRIRSLPRTDPDSLLQTTFLKDDPSIGKSCKKLISKKGWECRDCGLTNHPNNNTTNNNNTSADHLVDWDNCPLITPRGVCKAVTTWDWDPRQVSMYDPLDPSEHRHIIYHYGMVDHVYEQVPCEKLDDCWDISKCDPNDDQPLTVFGYGDYATSLIKQAVELHPESLRFQPDPQSACLLLATSESFETPAQMFDQPFWNTGKNHFLWGADTYFGSNPDQPLNIYANFDHASLSTAAFPDASIRMGYDIPQATMRMTSPEFHYPHPSLPNNTGNGRRPLLLNFKGNIFPWPQVFWHHRYLAFEYWEDAPDIFCDVVCKRRRVGAAAAVVRKRQYETSRDSYADLLLNSTFAFCPGGGSVGSLRFAEALGLGAIPVVASEFVPPLTPEVDWNGCLVQVSEARIVDIPRIVREIPEKEVMARQRRCRYLFDKIIGWVPNAGGEGWSLDRNRSLALSLLIWRERIRAHLKFKQQGETLLRMTTIANSK